MKKTLVFLIMLSTPAQAQSLREPTLIYAAGAIMDSVSTYQFLTAQPHLYRETSPLLQWAHNDPVRTVLGLAAIDTAQGLIWHWYGRYHPTIAKWGLRLTGGYRASIAIYNWKG